MSLYQSVIHSRLLEPCVLGSQDTMMKTQSLLSRDLGSIEEGRQSEFSVTDWSQKAAQSPTEHGVGWGGGPGSERRSEEDSRRGVLETASKGGVGEKYHKSLRNCTEFSSVWLNFIVVDESKGQR